MDDDEFEKFQQGLGELIKYAINDDNLKAYLIEFFKESGIPELTAEHRRRVSKCKARLSYLCRLTDSWGNTLHRIAGVAVSQGTSQSFSLYFCRELRTIVSRQRYIDNGVSRWGLPESSMSYIKYLTHTEAADLIVEYKDSLKFFGW